MFLRGAPLRSPEIFDLARHVSRDPARKETGLSRRRLGSSSGL